MLRSHRPVHRGWLVLRLAIFAASFALMQHLYARSAGGALETFIVNHLTVGTAAALLDWADPTLGVTARGARLTAPGGGINVLNGCEGTDVAFLLISAFLVAPVSWRRRLAGVGIGLALVFVLNQVRVIALFHTVRSAREWFDVLHGTVAPLVLIAVTGAFFAFWVGATRSRGQDAAP
jgi:exosortase family protein XrtM